MGRKYYRRSCRVGNISYLGPHFKICISFSCLRVNQSRVLGVLVSSLNELSSTIGGQEPWSRSRYLKNMS